MTSRFWGSGGAAFAFSHGFALVTVTPPALATPTVTNVSTAGAAPLVLALSDGDYVAGKYLQWEFAGSLTPPKNGDGSYTTTTQSGVTFIDGDSWARLDLTLGYNTPSGAFAFHCRVLQDDASGAVTVTDQLGNTFTADASGWSTDYTDTIIVSVATWDPTHAETHVTFSNGNLTETMAISWGTPSGSRATIQPISNDTYFESVAGLGTGGNKHNWFGIVDTTFAVSTAGVVPGNSSALGCCYRDDGTIYHDSTFSSATSYTTGDKIGVRYNLTTKVCTFYKNGVVQTPTVTLTSVTAPYAYAAVSDNGDTLTANFGGGTFSFLPSGASMYG